MNVIVLGSSPNALVAAAMRAQNHQKVLLLEPRETFGGPAATEFFAPGFKVNTGLASLAIDPAIARRLDLKYTPKTQTEITARDANGELYTLREPPELPQAIADAVELLRAIHRLPAPKMPIPGTTDIPALAAIGAKLSGLGERGMHEVLRLIFMSVREFLESTDLTEVVRAMIAGVAVRGLSEGPYSPGTLYNYLHHAAREDGLFRAGAIGGVGAISAALVEAAKKFGVELRSGVGPVTIDVERGVARGVRLSSGEKIAADQILSDYDLKKTYSELISPTALDPEVNRDVRRARYRGTVARVAFALRDLDAFTEEPRGTRLTVSTVADLERAWDRAKRGALPSRLAVEATVPTLDDPSLAPAGRHVLDAWVQYVPRGSTTKEALADAVLRELEIFAPKLRDAVLAQHVSRPEDLEKKFGLSEGQIYGGELRLEQAFFLRAQEPIEGLKLIGSAAHPGGYEGLSGY